MKGCVLLVDDDPSLCSMVCEELSRMGFAVESTLHAEEAVRWVRDGRFEAVLTDLKMTGTDGLQLCRQIIEIDPDLPVVVMTAFGSLETAIGAIRAGAYDFLTKPFEIEALVMCLERAVQLRRLRIEVVRLRDVASAAQPIEGIVGESHCIRELASMVDRVADTEAPVLVLGETGTGKELVARALHSHGRRREGPFIAVNCAALPEPLLESELFGHRKGAFTGAHREHRGLFMQAERGTLLLDEVGELPLSLQVKLLRVLQERRVRPVGSNTEEPFDVRLVAATNQDLEDAVEAGRFRSDLLYRINVLSIDVPPLRARGNDILLLAQHFVLGAAMRSNKEVSGLTASAAARLLDYPWPGNVRELQNCMERAVALTEHDKIVVDDLPLAIRDHRPGQLPLFSHDPSQILPMEEVERRYIAHVLSQVGGSRTRAAKLLGIDRKTLYRKLRSYGSQK